MITVYSTAQCAACNAAKAWLKDNNIEFESKMVDEDMDSAKKMMSMGLRTVPQIFVNEELVGGWDELREMGVLGLQQKMGGF